MFGIPSQYVTSGQGMICFACDKYTQFRPLLPPNGEKIAKNQMWVYDLSLGGKHKKKPKMLGYSTMEDGILKSGAWNNMSQSGSEKYHWISRDEKRERFWMIAPYMTHFGLGVWHTLTKGHALKKKEAQTVLPLTYARKWAHINNEKTWNPSINVGIYDIPSCNLMWELETSTFSVGSQTITHMDAHKWHILFHLSFIPIYMYIERGCPKTEGRERMLPNILLFVI